MKYEVSEVRQTFLDFFKNKGHKIIKSGPLIPQEDQSLLFTNAGMNQFKNIFIKNNIPINKRATTSQYCIRAGGKHNDLDNIGYTTKHHTFFEMLGNFSFGDYFKEEAIQFAWELLTHKKWFNLSKNKFLITIYKYDYESYKIWKEKIQIPPKNIILVKNKTTNIYDSDNFWKMGNTGPCGPCSEIFYNHKNNSYSHNQNNTYLEIWNLVFIQYNQKNNNIYIPLSHPYIDTGMGLERISSVLQNVPSNYDIDTFKALISSIAQILKISKKNHTSLQILSDHIRSCAFLIYNNITPSNEGRGYVLRKIIRRAIRQGYKLGQKNIFYYKLVQPFMDTMQDITYPLKQKQKKIEEILRQEEEKFIYILHRGINIVQKEIQKSINNTITGETVVYIYDTYGFPIDLTIDICKENNIKVDIKKIQEIQKKNTINLTNKKIQHNVYINIKPTKFVGYKHQKHSGKIIAIFKENKKQNTIYPGDTAIIILNKTPFYAESGGQIGDTGTLEAQNGTIFQVTNTKKHQKKIFLHLGILNHGILSINMKIHAKINIKRRNLIEINHSSTHLLHVTLQNILGKNIQQKGSYISDKYLHFDFTYHQSLTQTQIYEIEHTVNKYIRNNIPITTKIYSFNKKQLNNIDILQYQKYGNNIRTIIVKNISTEFCGGTHTKQTGNIGIFHILSEYSISSGIRRIQAITGKEALKFFHQQKNTIQKINTIIHSNNQTILNKIQKLETFYKKFKKTIQKINLQKKLQKNQNIIQDIQNINNVPVLIKIIKNIEQKTLRKLIKNIKNKENKIIIILATQTHTTATIASYVTKNLFHKITANEIIQNITKKIHGKGGGTKNFAEGGGKSSIYLTKIISQIKHKLFKIL